MKIVFIYFFHPHQRFVFIDFGEKQKGVERETLTGETDHLD